MTAARPKRQKKNHAKSHDVVARAFSEAQVRRRHQLAGLVPFILTISLSLWIAVGLQAAADSAARKANQTATLEALFEMLFRWECRHARP